MHDRFSVVELNSPQDDKPEILSRCEGVLAPLGYFFDSKKIDLMPHLRVIGSNTTGHPHIDVEYALSRGVRVETLKGYPDFLDTITPTAEHAWGLILALTRNLVPASRSVLLGNWDRRPFGGKKMLSKMDLGIIGLGRLGKKVAGYGCAFGMRVRYYDPFVESRDARFEKMSTIEAVVGASDVVSLHVPHEKATENLISAEVFSKFKKGAYFINTSRGEIIDQFALLENLEAGHLSGAALDVIAEEYSPDFAQKWADHPLLAYAQKNSKLLLTPHIGGSTLDAWDLTERFTLERVWDVFQNGVTT